MYYTIVALLMFAFPVLSIAYEATMHAPQLLMPLVGKWFVFWSVGVRLFLAGTRQVIQPKYTAQVILGLKSEESLLLVRELGFGNLALGTLGIISLFLPAWQLAAALAGGIFYGLAGVNHVLHQHRNRLQNTAMVSDLFAAAVLIAVCVASVLGK